MLLSIDDKLLEEVKNISIDAGSIILNKLGGWKNLSYKNEINLVTEVDKDTEEYIIKSLSKINSEVQILSEETSKDKASFKSLNKWIIDPIDGTTNFVHGFPFFCVSIALMLDSEITLGVVHDPVRKETFFARKGHGAHLNENPIKVSSEESVPKSLLATGFSYGFKTDEDDNIKHFIDFLKLARGVRRAGSATLDLCYVACGRFDGFWELHLYPWDTAAASLIINEAGGKVTNFTNQPYNTNDKDIIASNGNIHPEMLKIINKI